MAPQKLRGPLACSPDGPPFGGEEKQGSGRMFCFRKSKTEQSGLCFDDGAEDGIRTRDFHLGKVTLYH